MDVAEFLIANWQSYIICIPPKYVRIHKILGSFPLFELVSPHIICRDPQN